MKSSIALLSFLLAILIAISGFALFNQKPPLGGAIGSQSPVATSSSPTVTSTASLVFATSSCTARVISTTGLDGLRITFSDIQGRVPSNVAGLWQAPSTTIAYDSGQYGCGAVRIYSGASQVITVQETR